MKSGWCHHFYLSNTSWLSGPASSYLWELQNGYLTNNYMVDTFSTMVEHLDWYVVSHTGSEYWQWFLITPHLSTHSFSAKHSEEYFWLVLIYWQVTEATAPPPYLWLETLVNVSVTTRVTDQVNVQLCSMEKLRCTPINKLAELWLNVKCLFSHVEE